MIFFIGFVAAVLAALAIFSTIWSARLEAKFPPQGKFVAVSSGRLHYIERRPVGAANGVTVLLLHGASGNALEIDLPLGRRLAEAGYRTIAFDRPGHGWSDRPDGRADASPARQAVLISQALDALGIGPTLVVGHSLSGALATNMALDHKDHVAALLLLSAATHPWEGGVAWQNTAVATPVIGEVMAQTIVVPLGLMVMDKAADRVFLPRHAPDGYIDAAAIPLLLRPKEFRANAEDISGLYDFVSVQASRYGEIEVPTTVMTADRDTIVYPDTHSRAIVKQIEGSQLVILSGAGHMPHHTATSEVIEEINALAQRVRGAAPAAALP